MYALDGPTSRKLLKLRKFGASVQRDVRDDRDDRFVGELTGPLTSASDPFQTSRCPAKIVCFAPIPVILVSFVETPKPPLVQHVSRIVYSPVAPYPL